MVKKGEKILGVGEMGPKPPGEFKVPKIKVPEMTGNNPLNESPAPTKTEWLSPNESPIIVEPAKAEQLSPIRLMEKIKNIMERFKGALSVSAKEATKNKLLDELKREINQTEKVAVREGVNFAKCQFDKIIKDYKAGKKVELDAMSPYLADYNTVTGEIWQDKLTNSDKIGLGVIKKVREYLPRVGIISLYDEYNSNMPDAENVEGFIRVEKQKDLSETTDFHKPGGKAKNYKYTSMLKGAPVQEVVDESTGKIKNASQLDFSEEAKQNFRDSLKDLFKQEGIIRENDKEGEEYAFISESSKIKDAENLVAQLDAKGLIERNGEEINFVNADSSNPIYDKIQLRTPNGRWMCSALDASSYINPKNLEITHLVVLPNEFKEQQDQVWEIVRSLGIDELSYHNIFYDKDIEPEKVARVIEDEIKKYI